MRILFRTEGGIASVPGMEAPVTIDTAELPREAAAEIEALVMTCLNRPSVSGEAPSGTADAQRHTITVTDGSGTRTLAVSDPVDDPDLSALVARLRAETAAVRRRQGPAPD